MTVDTACSSSLVALHLASQALRGGECSLALVGGATVIGSPGVFIEFSRQRGLAPDGRCKAFAEGADGTGFAEGAGVLVLERLSDARANGHPVLATVRGSAVNQDGASNGLTAPNGPSQERVIRQALANARLEPQDVDAVEAHGTGTTLGDPIEAGALLATYGQEREVPLRLGSLKSNIGHAQAAAGVGGVIKTVMAMREGVLPKTLHVDAPSSKVDWEQGQIELLTEPVEWTPNGHPRRAGVSSFGISGTNAHVILEQAPEPAGDGVDPRPAAGSGSGAPAKSEQSQFPSGQIALALSAKAEPALRESASRLAAHLRANPDLDPLDVAFSLATTRTSFEHRAVAFGSSREDLLGALDALGQGEQAPGTSVGRAASGAKLAYLFTGQGSQRAGMGRELYESHPAFKAALDEVLAELDPHLDRPLKELLFAEPGSPEAELLDHTTYAQPALFALQVALFEALRSQGLKPDLLAGHSIGEISAAHLAGVFSLADAAKLVAARGRLMGALPEGGAMVAIEATEAEAREAIAGKEGELSIAAINAPRAVVLSGEQEPAEDVAARFGEQGRKTKRLSVSHAFHSPLMEPMLEHFAEVASSLAYGEPQIPLVSNTTGEILSPEQATDPAYWVAHVRQPVRFADALANLGAQGASAYLELGPDPVLSAMAAECLEAGEERERPATLVPTLREGRPEARALATALAEAHACGAKLDWDAFFEGAGAKRVALPTYPFQRQRYWLDSSAGTGDPATIGQAAADHPLLAAVIEDPEDGSLALSGRISLQSHPWLADHAVLGTAIFPGAGFIELALRAAEQVGAAGVEELTLLAPLALAEGEAVQLRVSVSPPDQGGGREIAIHARAEGTAEWTRHAGGAVAAQGAAARRPLDPAEWPPPGAQPIEIALLYDRLAEGGVDYGPAFRGLTAAWQDGEDLYAEVSLPQGAGEAPGFGIHPALLDSALHPIGLFAAEGEPAELPFAWSAVALGASRASELRVRLSRRGEGAFSLRLSDLQGATVAEIGSLALRPLDPRQLRGSSQQDDALFGVDWRELSPPAPAAGAWAVLGEGESAAAVALCAAEAPLTLATDLAALRAAFDDGAEVPGTVLCQPFAGGSGSPCADVRTAALAGVELVQQWLAEERFVASQLVLLTRDAVVVDEGESPDLAAAALWGLLRAAQAEQPDRFVLVDCDGSGASLEALAAAVASGEPQLALRQGRVLVPRVTPVRQQSGRLLPPAGPWRLDAVKRGTLDGLALVPSPAAEGPLGATGVRVAMRAAGLNFRDVLIALGLYPGEAPIGSEGAGVVVEVGADVTDLAPGERVMGMVADAFAPLAIAERQLLAPIPAGWSFEQAAAVPVAFLTAHYGLHDLAGLRAGERVLVHAGAGGVGMAAIQLAHEAGAEVFATASPAKWEALREAGLAEDHIASSRDLDFRDKFLETTGGEGVDVVLNSLAGEYVDASLQLLPRGGRFLEMGKTDIRDPERVAAEHPNVSYGAFDLVEAGPQRLGEALAEVLGRFERGALQHSPIASWDVRDAPEAFRHLREGNNVGKVVLSLPRPIDPEKTVLITGGSGALGGLIARHLVAEHGARHLLLASRSGAEAAGAAELRAELEGLGAAVTIAACDVSDRSQLEQLLAAIPGQCPLGAVVHAAGVIDDGTIESISAEKLERVFAPKADAAWHLHELTADIDLSAFVLFSSVAATFGGAGQANYAAANAFLDALAEGRRAAGLPATSMAWGLWGGEGGMAASLGEADLARLQRSGIDALSAAQGLDLFDAALRAGRARALPVRLDPVALRQSAAAGALPAILGGLVRTGTPRSAPSGALASALSTLSEAEREAHLLGLVVAEVASVLGHGSAEAVDPRRAFKELGFDSLAAVELRNRLKAATGIRLTATAVFDHPTSAALARHLLAETGAGDAAGQATVRAQASDEPIAIVGMACRYPGGIGSPRGLWELLLAGGDGIGEFPTDRGWDLERLYHPDPDHPGTSYVREGGFLYDAADFDAEFFGIAPREALAADPQQRILLEACWEALEGAGIDPASLRGEPAGVFAGISSQDYSAGLRAVDDESEGYRLTGSSTSIVSGRVAYAFGLEGPAMTVDTACSSSLVAMHLAAGALRGGECSLALAGGVTVLGSAGAFTELSRQRGLAPDGRCKAFAEGADGTGFSEGVGVLVLERLSEAQANGHPVLATIRGSAVNQDGASNGLTAPNGPSQERVIRQALANAGLQPADVDAVEAHGTGTTLGDPIEAGALLATYGQDREAPLKLGSLKSNIGHAQAAAGVGGVIKMVLAMREGVLPKTLHVEQPSSKVDWETGKVELLSEPVEWKPNGHPRRAGVSSFGISGTNAHLILEEAPEPPAAGRRQGAGGPGASSRQAPLPGQVPLALSAKSQAALREAAERLATRLRDNPELDPTDVAHSLATTRSAFEQRAVAVGAERPELLGALDALASGGDAPGLARGVARKSQAPVFLFPGQGSQWQGMAAQLSGASAVFDRALDQCEAALAPFLDFSVKDVLLDKEGAASIDRIEVVQPALFAVMVSLARLWEACGVRPAAVIGHSQGEIAAAHISGGLSLDDAARLAALRSQLISKLTGQGAMVSVALPASQLDLGRWDGRIELAAQNGPSSTILSAEREAVGEFLAHCEQEDVRAKEIPATIPSHSARVEPLRAELLELLAPISPQSSEVPFYSTVSGEALDTRELDAEYWYRNLRQPVLFEQVTRELASQGHSAFIEVSPHPVFALAVGETLEAALPDSASATVLGTLRREEGGPDRFALSLAEAQAQGVALDWGAFFAGSGAKSVPLPTYPFQRTRYWLNASTGAGDLGAAGLEHFDHPLLGAAIEDPESKGLTLSGRISLQSHPWLADHAVSATVLLPGTAFLELALAAAERVGAGVVEELTIEAPLVLPEQGAVALRLSLAAADERGRRELSIHSRPEGEEGAGQWTRNAAGALGAEGSAVPAPFEAWPPEGAEPLGVEDLYERFAGIGLDYGPAFQGLTAAWRVGEEVCAEVSLPEQSSAAAQRFAIHPALLDSALHAVGLTEAGMAELRLPFSWRGVSLGSTGAAALRVRVVAEGADGVAIAIADQDGAPVAGVDSLALRAVDPAQLQTAGQAGGGLLGVEWSELELGQSVSFAETEEPAAIAERGDPPEVVLWRLRPDPDPEADAVTAARDLVAAVLRQVQAWIGRDDLAASRLAVLTEGAISVGEDESPDLAQAAVWGLLRSAQSEHPGRFALVDSDGSEASEEAVAAALASEEEPQLALRDGVALAPRAAAVEGGDSLLQPPGPWRLDVRSRGTLESLALVPNPGAEEPLGPSEVRIAMRAAGLNFRDVLIALGLYPGAASIGGEGAGVVVEVGPEVGDLAPGEPVMGLVPGAFAPLAIAERDFLAPVPGGWSFEQAASVPTVFLTAHYGLLGLAGLQAGERVLVHAGAGGVGMAAIQLAQHLGAEVFATASPAKWDALREIGVAESHLASSRDLSFKDKFLEATGGEGVDVVLNSLAGEYVDASLQLLPRGGRFLEMGKTDVRDAELVAAAHPGVSYRAFDLRDAGPEPTRSMLGEVLELFERGALRHSPIASWDLRRAPEAFRHLREGNNVGKVVLSLPRPIDPEKTVLITGGSGALGGLVARHLVAEHGARHLLLASRSGAEAAGAAELRAELEGLGAAVTIAACDVSEREQLAELFDAIPAGQPLGAVLHAAGALDDGTIESLGAEKLERVFAPKAGAAWHLHELTAGAELSAFVLFSSAAGILGAPGQANYAAANSFLDALAAKRHAEGLAATSIAWGLWRRESAMASHLGEADLARIRRSGLDALADEAGLALFDEALACERPAVVALGLDRIGLRSQAASGALPAILRGLARAPSARRSADGASFGARLAKLPADEREAAVLELVRDQVATVLGHDSAEKVEPGRAFKELGFDSLAAVELRNRLNLAAGLRLPATVVFDHPNPAELAAQILVSIGLGEAQSGAGAGALASEFDRLESVLAGIESADQREDAVARLRELLAGIDSERGEDLADASDEEMFDLLDRKLGRV